MGRTKKGCPKWPLASARRFRKFGQVGFCLDPVLLARGTSLIYAAGDFDNGFERKENFMNQRVLDLGDVLYWLSKL
jgi:hypothetical protein